MPRLVKGGLIQCSNPINDEDRTVKEIQDAALEKHIPFIEDAGQEGVQILCLQEIFKFEQTGIDESGHAKGQFEACGVRPRSFARLHAEGSDLLARLFERRSLTKVGDDA